tara:strand:- start:53 stop:526 length:474 start_codon:yes stop_codon:yes gene_type:complete
MGSIFGKAKRGFGKALRPKGPGVLRPKPTDRYGQTLKPKPIRPGKKDGGMPETDKERQNRILKSVKMDKQRKRRENFGAKKPDKRPTPDQRQQGPRRKLKPVRPSQKGLQSLPKPVRNKMGYMKDGGRAKKFPDLSGDGKVTKKDVLIGRGVIKRKK